MKMKKNFGRPEYIFNAHNNKITRLLLDSGNNKLISSSLDKTFKIWDIPSLNPEFIIKEPKNEIYLYVIVEKILFLLGMIKNQKFGICKVNLNI